MNGGPMQNMAVSTPYIFQGGLDQASSSLAVPGGRCIAAINYEPVVNGYQRVGGHERFDGRLPSEATYILLDFDAGLNGMAVGDTLTGLTSAATGMIANILNPSGNFGAGTGVGTLVLTAVTGTFLDNEQLQEAGSNRCRVDGVAYQATAGSLDHYLNLHAAATRRRTLIGAPSGSGPVRGGFVLNGDVYAVRDNAGATLGVLHKATPAGWVAQSFGRWIRFLHGLVEVTEGQVITGATSAATATVQRIIVQEGEWGAVDPADQAFGYFVLSGQTGVFTAGETLKVGATNVATNNHPTGDSDQLIFPAGGRYHFKVKNFYGATDRKRVYGVSGVHFAFEYDGGSVLVPIFTGTPNDQPTRVFEIANHLGFTFPGGSVQVSSPGEPCVFNAILGAAEIGMGDDITDVIDANDSAVILFCKEKVGALTGRGIDSFVLDELSEEAGAEAWTAQRIGKTLYLDRRGLRDLNATAAFGNFKTGAISELFERFLQAKRRAGATPVASLRVKGKSQYRLYYDDGTGFTVYMGRKAPEMLPFETDVMRVYAAWSGELDDGSEGLFAGAEDGYVYRLDSGNVFDGTPVRAFVMLPFNHLGTIGQNKRFQTVSIELDAPSAAPLQILAQYDYGNGQEPLSGIQNFGVFGSGHFATVEGGGGDFIVASGGGSWDPSTWDQFFTTAYQGTAEAEIGGAGRNISLVISSPGFASEPAHTLQSLAIRWVPRGQVKRTGY